MGATMTLLDNAKTVATQAWSMWGLYLLTLFSGLDAFLPLVADYKPLASPAFSAAVTAVSAITAFLRLLPQPGLTKDAAQ